MNNKIKLIVLTSMIILWMGFIFNMSAKNASQSSYISGSLTYDILNHIDAFEELDEDRKEKIVDDLQFVVRKGAHFTAYTILSALCFIDIGIVLKDRLKLRFVLSFAIAALYAVFDELHQYFVPGRSCEIRDMLIDSSGALVGILLMIFVDFILRKIKGFRKN